MNSQTSALIVARSAQLRGSLLVLLRALPRIEEIYQADDGDSALRMSQQIRPALVLVDHDLSQIEVQATLERIKVAWPQTCSVVLLDDEQDRRGVEAAGADMVLVKGMLAAKVLDMIDAALEAEVRSHSPA
jgi:DNA-binding NarL/FixJ family response regulator